MTAQTPQTPRPPLPLVPFPVFAEAPGGRMPLRETARLHGDGPALADLHDAILRRTGLALPSTRGAVEQGDIVLRLDPSVATAEGYTLTVDDHAEIIGADAAGLFYGIQTLLQLVQQDDEGWSLRRAVVSDAPRFGYRGVMLDVARHFFGVADVQAFIDRVSALKFNHLHLHLSDDQGWRVHIDAWPLLTTRASGPSANGDPGGFYTKDDYRAIVAYAASKHMVVVPEIDLPGHTHAIGLAYPELVEAPVMNDTLLAEAADLGQPLPVAGEPYTGWGVGHSSVRIREESTYRFVRDVLTELAELTPGPYLHIGGDEALGTTPADFASFVERVSALTVEIGKTPVAWHEVGAAPGIAEGTVGQYWGNTTPAGAHAEEARHFIERGGTLIMSASNVAYLDMKYTPDFPLGATWAAIIDVRTAYEWEPTAVLGVPERDILGVETPLWTETLRTLADLDLLLFPRAAAQAEIAWSPRESPERTWGSLRARVARFAPAWRHAGIGFHPSPEIPWAEADAAGTPASPRSVARGPHAR